MESLSEAFIRLLRDGQSQTQRPDSALDPAFAKVDDRSLADLLAFAKNLAAKLIFFDTTNTACGDWTPFFDFDPDTLAAKKGLRADHEPHLALYLTFLLLLQHGRAALNDITARHLDFYYQQVLGQVKKAGSPDYAQLLFKLKKNSAVALLKKGIRLSAGKDADGKDRLYSLTADTFVHPAQVAELKSVFHDSVADRLYAAPVANSADGLGAALSGDEPKWAPFGTRAMPQAAIGFALSSPALRLASGKRTITVRLTLTGRGEWDTLAVSGKDLFQVYLTGPKGWTTPVCVSLNEQKSQRGNFDFSLKRQKNLSRDFAVSLTLDEKTDPVTDYDPTVHLADYRTRYPVMKLVLNPDLARSGLAHWGKLGVEKICLKVSVEGLPPQSVSNDAGKIDATKPFMPFGPIPQIGSKCRLQCPELAGKNLRKSSVSLLWKVPTGNLNGIYVDYNTKGYSLAGSLSDILQEVAQTSSTVHYSFQQSLAGVIKDFSVVGKTPTYSLQNSLADVLKDMAASGIISNYSFLATLTDPCGRKSEHQHLFCGTDARQPVSIPANAPDQTGSTVPAGESNVFTLSLETGFYHDLYRKLLPERVAKMAAGDATAKVPSEPYTPVIESVSVSYEAEESWSGDAARFFHVMSFGQAIAPTGAGFLPRYDNEGELYIGITGLSGQSQVSLLIQAAQGSANPDKSREDVAWDVLSDNQWVSLQEGIASDATCGLLKSGVITFAVPAVTLTTNTILSGDKIWLRASVRQNSDAVCRLIDIQANAAAAVLSSSESVARTLPPQSISKFIESVGAIKTVTQPYASSDGREAETVDAFRTRVSERLRHKDRAVTLWDYERLVLEAFPSVYRVKCLNYTSVSPTLSFAAPGHVTLVVIPDLHNKNAVDPLQPKVDLATMVEIQNFLKSRTSPFVTLHVTNPFYEAVRFKFKVAFRRTSDFGYYSNQLQQDLKNLLCPWAAGNGDIHFEGMLHGSQVIDYIEKLSYVDRIENFVMSQETLSQETLMKRDGVKGIGKAVIKRRAQGEEAFFYQMKTVAASSPLSILVSASDHDIKAI